MTKQIFKIIFAFLTAFLVVALLFSKKQMGKKPSKEETTTNISYYIVSEYNGQIAVFINDDKTPVKIYDSYVSTLPQKDQVTLKEGIKVETQEELQLIIEDYTS